MEVLSDRYHKEASKKPLGTAADLIMIDKVIIAHMNIEASEVEEIRWLSPELVMAHSKWYHGPLAAAHYWYVVAKKDSKWTVITRYMLSVS